MGPHVVCIDLPTETVTRNDRGRARRVAVVALAGLEIPARRKVRSEVTKRLL
jgi:hypothetical protein